MKNKESDPNLQLNLDGEFESSTDPKPDSVIEPNLSLKPDKTLNIAVSGDVRITKLEREIIDTSDFQRLRGIRQLGYAFHVYPTALHTRFDHSLGTLKMAEIMIQSIRSNLDCKKEEREITLKQEILARLYALLHDITHIPFGHTIEDELGLLTRHDLNANRILRFLGPNSEIGQVIKKELGDDLYNRFMSIYIWHEQSWKEWLKEIGEDSEDLVDSWGPLEEWYNAFDEDDAFIYDLVSNTVCADLLDYIARDNYFCNLGEQMRYRFLNFLFLHDIEDGGRTYKRLFVRLWKDKGVPRRDTLTDLARLLEARYLLAERVYFHHAKGISSTMLGRALQEELLSGGLKEEDLYNNSDDTLLKYLSESKNEVAQRLAQALLKRELHKDFKFFNLATFSGIQSQDRRLNQLKKIMSRFNNPEERRILEDKFAEEIDAQKGDILIYAPSFSMNTKVADVKTIWNGEPTSLKDIDDGIIQPRLKQILAAHEMLWELRFFVSRDLNPHQKKLLELSIELHTVCPPDELEDKTKRYYKEIVRYEVLSKYGQPPMPPIEIEGNINSIVDGLLIPATDKKAKFQKRLTTAIDKLFKPNE